MKKQLAYSGVALLAAGMLFAATAAQQANGNQNAAQPGTMHGHMGMMQGRMGTMYGRMGNTMQGRMGMNYGSMGGMRGMMMSGLQNPVGRSTMMAFMLPEMKSELGLSSPQTAKLNELRRQFADRQQKTSDQVAAARQDLDAQFKSAKPNESQVKKDVNGIAKLQAQRLLNGYETTAKMKATLTPEQRNRLQNMNPTGLYNSMMSHMSVNQMREMMGYMYGRYGAAMMPGGTMGNGMMGNGMMGNGMMANGMPGCGVMGMMLGQTAPQRP